MDVVVHLYLRSTSISTYVLQLGLGTVRICSDNGLYLISEKPRGHRANQRTYSEMTIFWTRSGKFGND